MRSLFLAIHWTVAGWQGKLWGPLEYMEMACLSGDDRDGLNAGGAGSDNANAQTSEIDIVMWPLPGVIPLALEGI